MKVHNSNPWLNSWLLLYFINLPLQDFFFKSGCFRSKLKAIGNKEKKIDILKQYVKRSAQYPFGLQNVVNGLRNVLVLNEIYKK